MNRLAPLGCVGDSFSGAFDQRGSARRWDRPWARAAAVQCLALLPCVGASVSPSI